jgi:hypothetical protein
MTVQISKIDNEIVAFTIPARTNCLSCRVPHKDRTGICVAYFAGNGRVIDLSEFGGKEDISNCGVITTVRSSQ